MTDKLRNKIANIEHTIAQPREDISQYKKLGLEIADQILSMLEPVELEALTFGKDAILGLIPAQAILDYDRAKEVLDEVSQATIRHNQAKGQLFRLLKEEGK